VAQRLTRFIAWDPAAALRSLDACSKRFDGCCRRRARTP
jgi:hypothetical protein